MGSHKKRQTGTSARSPGQSRGQWCCGIRDNQRVERHPRGAEREWNAIRRGVGGVNGIGAVTLGWDGDQLDASGAGGAEEAADSRAGAIRTA